MKLLSALMLPHFSLYKTYVNVEDKKILFFNPKVASTTLRILITDAYIQANKKPFRSALWPISKVRRYTAASLRDYKYALNHIEDFDLYAFVRNPYTRVISAWRDKIYRGHFSGYPKSVKPEIPLMRRFAKQNELLGAADGSLIPFTTFLQYIDNQNEGSRNQHWDTQISVLNTNSFRFSRLYKIETEFELGITELLRNFNLDNDWFKQRVNLKANKSSHVYESPLTDETAALIGKIYQSDFNRLGYSTSWHNPQ